MYVCVKRVVFYVLYIQRDKKFSIRSFCKDFYCFGQKKIRLKPIMSFFFFLKIELYECTRIRWKLLRERIIYFSSCKTLSNHLNTNSTHFSYLLWSFSFVFYSFICNKNTHVAHFFFLSFQLFPGTGASFILYNSARIETILRKFNEKVECNYYKPLPDLTDIDISLLLNEEVM